MELVKFVRRPFMVEAVEITTENIHEVAKHVGEVVEKEDGTVFIKVDRRKVAIVDEVYPGYWMTRMGKKVRCYSGKIFKQQFVEAEGPISDFVDSLELNGNTTAETQSINNSVAVSETYLTD